MHANQQYKGIPSKHPRMGMFGSHPLPKHVDRIIILHLPFLIARSLTYPSMTLRDVLPSFVAGGALARLANARYIPFIQLSTEGNGSASAI